ncbi:MAG: 5'-nucleotidase C-terminal domain-containing protein [Bacteroidales bacterium]|jgi:2',3'-cyclic-nucleotide 2'-phosphodiesterase (5'-nucleotidase family)|nr:5'-nucleotidase C-terminal domain-containing protein [Bacteroidales bacterium]
MRKKTMYLLLALMLLTGCIPPSQSTHDHEILTILSFNDFHGQFVPDDGIAGAARLVRTIRKNGSPYGRTMVLCGGDNFSGTYFSSATNACLQDELYRRCYVKYSVIGNHEFDWGIDTLISFATKGNITYLSANIFTDSTMTERPYWLKPYAIRHIELISEKILRVAVIGLTTIQTKSKTKASGTETVFFADPYPAAKDIMASLKDSAEVYIILAHIGASMKDGVPVFDAGEKADSLPYIDGLHAIIAAHSHNVVEGYINNVPIVEAGCYGNFVGKINLDISHKRVVYSDVDIVSTSRYWQNRDMKRSVQKIMDSSLYNFSEVLTVAQREIPYNYTTKQKGFTELGAMVTTAYDEKFKSLMPATNQIVISVSNYGAIRVPLKKGNVTMLKAGNALPFGGELLAYEVTGKELKTLFQYGIFGTAKQNLGFAQSNDLEITVKDSAVISIRHIPSQKIIADEDCVTVVAESFVTTGGDGYPKIFTKPVKEFNSIPADKRNPTMAFADYLRSKKTIDLNTANVCKVNNE